MCLRRFLPGSAASAVIAAVLAISTPAAAEEDASGDAERDFRAYCASCHGWNGDGNGPVADVLKVRPPDLTRIAARNGGTFPVDAVAQVIDGAGMPMAHGTTQMPVWGLWFTYQEVAETLHTGDKKPVAERVAERISGLVAYLQTIQQ